DAGVVDDAVDAWRRLRDRVRDLGRSVADFGADYVVRPQGGLDDVTAKVEAWREAGGTHATVATMGLDLDSVDGHLDYIASVAGALALP
ncbi:MAG TPA: hypothetical protein VFR49_16490, partial [Solirubrobacteraceae bacterium]|nr:hypothetical protein [Solirubrobacteraceae bacterium]